MSGESKFQDTHYEKSLNYFYTHSNENEVDSCAISSILGEFYEGRKFLTWLDVGCGPGIKLFMIAEKLTKYKIEKLEMFCVDPSEYWISELYEQSVQNNSILNLKKTYLNKWESFKKNRYNSKKFDVITFIHSVYGIEFNQNIIPSLEKAKSLLKKCGTLIIVIESSISDIYKIKKIIYNNALPFDLVDFRLVENTLNCFFPHWKSLPDLEQKFYLGPTLEKAINNLDALSFIIQSSPGNLNKLLNRKQKKEIGGMLSKNLKNDELGYFLSVPDKIYYWCPQNR